ncbi:sensor histidine kinase [Paenibacillus thermotolerans]|uniref:sensor histidine kinase n=1 Tax=Paenibacillus thermotolerans TaxID=3027807 RepID=UPI002368A155|nr:MULTISPECIES: sensor histidine kinase [unclassified Paenibacillus]
MKLRHFLADRLWYAVVFLLNTLLVLTVIILDLNGQEASLQTGNVAYIGVLSAIGLLLFLFIDYLRQRGFYLELRQADKLGEGQADKALLLQSAVTNEQLLLQQTIERQYRAYADRLAELQAAQERQIHFMQQWAHQMKTPVSVIHLITQQTAGPLGKEDVDSIREECDRIHQGVSTLLHAARLDRFDRDVHIRRIPLLPLLRGAVNEYKSAWIRYGLFPKIHAEAAEAEVESDEKWLSFVVSQLLMNAVKYSAAVKKDAENGAEVVLTVRRQSEGVILEIRDRGIGIPKEDLPRVFEPFFTGRNGRLVPESTGMGLYLAKQACGRLGHRLTVDSAEGEGTSVTIAFGTPQVTFREALGR